MIPNTFAAELSVTARRLTSDMTTLTHTVLELIVLRTNTSSRTEGQTWSAALHGVRHLNNNLSKHSIAIVLLVADKIPIVESK